MEAPTNLKDPVDQRIADRIAKAEVWVIFSRPDFPIVFRYGPFTSAQVEPIMTQMLAKNVKGSFVYNCGPEIDWDLATDLCTTAPENEETPAK